jgi:predicted permease
MFVLLALAGLVLLIACTNLATMQLARSTVRHREIAMRTAMGAGRVRLIRQLLLESLILSVGGGAIGIAVASWTGKIIFGFLPQGHAPIALDLAPDARVLWFTIGISLLTSVLFGLTPALQSTRGNVAIALKTNLGRSTGDVGGANLRKSFLISQVALSLLLLIMAGLFQRSLANLRTLNVYPQADRVLVFRIKPQEELYDHERMRNLTAEVVRRISDLPGVKSAAFAEEGPLGSRGAMRAVVHRTNGQAIDAAMDLVGPGFFETLGVRVLEGREFSIADDPGSRPVAIINDVLARRLFQGEKPNRPNHSRA